jgi:hypothetical protein
MLSCVSSAPLQGFLGKSVPHGDTGRALLEHVVGDDGFIQLQRGAATVLTGRVGQEL